MDKIKLLVAGLLVVAGIAGYYVLADGPAVLRVLSVLAGLALAATTVWFTGPGKQFYGSTLQAVAGARTIVWPTRKETMKLTRRVHLVVIKTGLSSCTLCKRKTRLFKRLIWSET